MTTVQENQRMPVGKIIAFHRQCAEDWEKRARAAETQNMKLKQSLAELISEVESLRAQVKHLAEAQP